VIADATNAGDAVRVLELQPVEALLVVRMVLVALAVEDGCWR